MKRRDMCRLIPLVAAGFTGIANTAFSRERNHKHGMRDSPEPLAIRYTRKVRDMLIWIRETQSENLLEASYAIARTVKNGGKFWCSWDMGHNTLYDIFPERNGVPEFITMGYNAKETKKGDLFLASIWGGPHEDLVKKEIFVIGGPAPWGGDAKGQALLREDVQKLKLRPYSHIWIETNITTYGAIMHVPGEPAPLGPVSGIIGLATLWMMVGDACRVLARDRISAKVTGDEPKLSGDSVPWVNLNEPLMDDYFEQLMLQIEMIGAELGDIRRIAEMAVDSVLAGGKVYCYSRYRNSLAVEGHHRRGGLALTRGVCEREGRLTSLDGYVPFEGSSKDCVIMGIWEPDNEIDIKNLDIFRKTGMKIASIGPMTRDITVPEGRTIPRETDIHVGRMCDTYGLYAVPGFERKVCPTSGAVINQIWWATCMEITEEIIRRTGNAPGIFFSGALKVGREHNNHIMIKYNERGY